MPRLVNFGLKNFPAPFSVEKFFVSLAEFRSGGLTGGDRDSAARLGIDSVSGVLFFYFKGRKTGDVNVFAALQGIGKSVDERLKIMFCLFDRYAEVVGIRSYKFAFVHNLPPMIYFCNEYVSFRSP